MRDYVVQLGDFEYVAQYEEETAKRMGLKPVQTRARKPANKAAKSPRTKAKS